MPPKKEKKKSVSQGTPSTVVPEKCFCHNGLIQSCIVCQSNATIEVLDLKSEDIIEISKEEIKLSVSSIVCRDCQQAAIDSMGLVNDVFIRSSDTPVKQEEKKEKLKEEEVSEVTPEKVEDSIPQLKFEGRTLIKVSLSDSTLLKFKVSTGKQNAGKKGSAKKSKNPNPTLTATTPVSNTVSEESKLEEVSDQQEDLVIDKNGGASDDIIIEDADVNNLLHEDFSGNEKIISKALSLLRDLPVLEKAGSPKFVNTTEDWVNLLIALKVSYPGQPPSSIKFDMGEFIEEKLTIQRAYIYLHDAVYASGIPVLLNINSDKTRGHQLSSLFDFCLRNEPSIDYYGAKLLECLDIAKKVSVVIDKVINYVVSASLMKFSQGILAPKDFQRILDSLDHLQSNSVDMLWKDFSEPIHTFSVNEKEFMIQAMEISINSRVKEEGEAPLEIDIKKQRDFLSTYTVRLAQVCSMYRLVLQLHLLFSPLEDLLKKDFGYEVLGYENPHASPELFTKTPVLPDQLARISFSTITNSCLTIWDSLNSEELNEPDFLAFVEYHRTVVSLSFTEMENLRKKILLEVTKEGSKPKVAPIWTKILKELNGAVRDIATAEHSVMTGLAPFVSFEVEKDAYLERSMPKNDLVKSAIKEAMFLIDFNKSVFHREEKPRKDGLSDTNVVIREDGLHLKSFIDKETQIALKPLIIRTIENWDHLIRYKSEFDITEKELKIGKVVEWKTFGNTIFLHWFKEQYFSRLLQIFMYTGILGSARRNNAAWGCVAQENHGEKGAKRVLERILAKKVQEKVIENVLFESVAGEVEKSNKAKEKKERLEKAQKAEKEKKQRELEAKLSLEKQELQEKSEREEKLRLEKEEREEEKRRLELAESLRIKEEDARLLNSQRAAANAEKRRLLEEEKRKAQEKQVWECLRCTSENNGLTNACFVCEWPKGKPAPPTIVDEEPPQKKGPKPMFNQVEDITSVAPVEPYLGLENLDVTALSPPVVASPSPPVSNIKSAAPSIPVDASANVAKQQQPSFITPSKVAGLTNNVGENSCFLNVVVQSLWHLKSFSSKFMEHFYHSCAKSTDHDKTCLVCSLKETFQNLNTSQDSLVSSVDMRKALSQAFGSVFVLGEKEDAGEAFECILKALHNSLSTCPAQEATCLCLVHSTLGSNFFEGVECTRCAKSLKNGTFEHLKFPRVKPLYDKYGLIPSLENFTSFVRYVPAILISNLEGDFNSRLSAALDVEDISCPVCDRKGLEVQRVLIKAPTTYSIGIIWTSNQPPEDEIKSFCESVSETIDLCQFEGRIITPQIHNPGSYPAKLRGLMCYYGSHYAAFFRPSLDVNPEGIWYMFDDSVVRPLGKDWAEVVRYCIASKFQPVTLFYEIELAVH